MCFESVESLRMVNENGKASVNITVLGFTNPDVNLKRMHQLFCYMTVSLYLVLFQLYNVATDKTAIFISGFIS